MSLPDSGELNPAETIPAPEPVDDRERVPTKGPANCVGESCINFSGVKCAAYLDLLFTDGKSGGEDVPPYIDDANYATFGKICTGGEEAVIVRVRTQATRLEEIDIARIVGEAFELSDSPHSIDLEGGSIRINRSGTLEEPQITICVGTDGGDLYNSLTFKRIDHYTPAGSHQNQYSGLSIYEPIAYTGSYRQTNYWVDDEVVERTQATKSRQILQEPRFRDDHFALSRVEVTERRTTRYTHKALARLAMIKIKQKLE